MSGLLCATAVSDAQTLQPLVLAVVPQHTVLQTHRMWTPLIKQILKDTGIEIRLKLYEKIPDFEQSFLSGVPDLVYLNPYHMILARKAQNYRPLLRDGASHLVGVLVVPKDSPAESVADLDGKQLAFPSPNALGSSLYMRALLSQHEKIKIKPRYVGNHKHVLLQVSTGESAGGGVAERTLEHESADIKQQVRVIYRTPGLPTHPIAAHPRIPSHITDKLSRAVMALGATRQGQELLAAIAFKQPVHADFARDYAPLEQLQLDRFASSPR